MRVLGIIPARAGSKRLPGKNTRLLGGAPLVQWVIDAAVQSRRISRLVVSTNDHAVWDIAHKAHPSLPLKRPDALCTDDSPAIDYVRHALGASSEEFDAVAIIQPTSPFTTAEDIDGALALLDASGADSVVTVCKVPFMYRPCKQLILNGGRVEQHGDDDGQERYIRNCSVYATRIESILQGKVIGDDCRGYVMPRERSVDINDEDDLEQAKVMREGDAIEA